MSSDQSNESPGQSQNKPAGFIRRCCTWKTFGRINFVLIVLVTLVVAFYVVANFRGKRAWDRYADEAKSRQVVLNLKDLIPPAVPDDQNFAAIPLFRVMFDFIPGTSKIRDTNALQFQEQRRRADELFISNRFGCQLELSSGNWRSGKVVDMADWLKPIGKKPTTDLPKSEAELLAVMSEAMSALDGVVGELCAAAKRPKTRYDIIYSDMVFDTLLPHLAAAKGLTQKLCARSLVHLRSGKTDAAFEEVQVMFRLADSFNEEPFLISQLVGLACRAITINAIWEGMRLHQWTESQLAWFQNKVESINSVVGMKQAMHGERACGVQSINYFIARPRFNPAALDDGMSLGGGAEFLNLMPRGWWQFEKLNLCLWYDKFEQVSTNAMDPSFQALIKPETEASTSSEKPENHVGTFHALWRNTVMRDMLTPALDKIWNKAANDQCMLHMASIACALERHRMAHGSYPASLSQIDSSIMPKVPLDLFARAPFHYKLYPDGRFQLYSVGPNRTDDGGKIEFNKSGNAVDIKKGDWVWEYPAAK